MYDIDPALVQDTSDEKPAMTVSRVLLRTHQSDAVAAETVLKPSDRLLETG
jgi:hypothetical protein